MIRYGMVRPAGSGPNFNLEKKTIHNLPENLVKNWLVGVFEGREKIADLFIVDENTLVSGPKSKLWKLAALIWNEDWQVIKHFHSRDGRMWIFTLQRGSEETQLLISFTTTFRVEGADIVPLAPESPPLRDKKHYLNAVKLARQLTPSINTEEGKLRCRLEQVEGEIELLEEEKIALIGEIGRCEVAHSCA